MFCIGIGITCIIGSLILCAYIVKDTLDNFCTPLYGFGFIFAAIAGFTGTLLGTIAILIGLLLRK